MHGSRGARAPRCLCRAVRCRRDARPATSGCRSSNSSSSAGRCESAIVTAVENGRRAKLRPVDVSLDLGIVPREPAPDVIELCVEAEQHGFGGLWVADSQAIFRDAFAILAVAAARTQRILLSTGVTNPVTRHPAVLAGSFATLDELAPGRVVVPRGRGES